MDKFQELIDKTIEGKEAQKLEEYSHFYVGAGLHLFRKPPVCHYLIGIYLPVEEKFQIATPEDIYSKFTKEGTSNGWKRVESFQTQWIDLYESLEIEKSLVGVFHE